MDMNTMLEERLIQCCVHVGTMADHEHHQCVPFCAAQAWPELASKKVGMVSTPVPLMQPSPIA
jgi:hypothetical protein